MNWQMVIEKMHQIESTHSGNEYDPFDKLSSASRGLHVAGVSTARVSMTVGRSLQYGDIKCSATVSIDCPQREAYIDLAAEVAYRKALELVNDGMSQFEVPRIGEQG